MNIILLSFIILILKNFVLSFLAVAFWALSKICLTILFRRERNRSERIHGLGHGLRRHHFHCHRHLPHLSQEAEGKIVPGTVYLPIEVPSWTVEGP